MRASGRTCSVDMNSALGSTGTSVPASHVVKSGVMTIAASVDAVVIMMERPISPCDQHHAIGTNCAVIRVPQSAMCSHRVSYCQALTTLHMQDLNEPTCTLYGGPTRACTPDGGPHLGDVRHDVRGSSSRTAGQDTHPYG